jgi:hypothetical protein
MLTPIRKLRLPDRPYHTSVSNDGKRFAICTKSGECCMFDNDLRQIGEMNFGAGVESIQLNTTGSLFIVGFHNRIEGYTSVGNFEPSFKLPVPKTASPSCSFIADDQVLCVATWDREPKLTAWDLRSARLIDEVVLPNRGGEGYMLASHPEGEALAAVAYSGQSEEWMFWAHYGHGRLRVFERPEIEDVAFPNFHPTGRELVSFHERLEFCRMRFPSGELIGSVTLEQAFPDNPDDRFSYHVHFLRDDHLLVWQCNLSLYEFDLATLRPVRAILSGVEGMKFGKDRFFSEGSWQLAGGRLLTSDSHHDKDFESRTDTLRLWGCSDLFGPPLAPDPERPYTKKLIAS